MLRTLRFVALALFVAALAPSAAPAADGASLVEVDAAGAGGAMALERRGLDVVEIGAGSVEVILHSARDQRALAASGYDSRVLIADLDHANDRVRAAEQRAEARGEASSLPTGRVSYRSLDEINAELRRLAAQHPDRVRLFRLREQSLLGKSIFGVEISHDVRSDSGKPVFLNTGVHHAREWPTAEFVLEFAWELLREDGRDPRITSLLERGRMIAVPVVNPDGYDISRRLVQEQKRKNCRIVAGEEPTALQCEAQVNANYGVDPNRNYGAFWGGPGSSESRTASNHRGAGPWSEPEIRNMRAIATANQVTVAINNHTPDERLLRAPSSSNEPEPADVVVYDALAQLLGRDLNWPAGPWTEIYYEASGTAEQTAYYGAGTLAFTPEATPGHGGAARFHPPYEYVVDQYLGTDFYAGSSIRRAFLTAFDAAVDPARHSVITGEARPGTELRIAKSFALDTSGGQSFPMTYRSTLTVPASGHFEWHVNPSVRPSQYASAHLPEQWTLACGDRSVQVTVRRGEAAAVDLSRCRAR
jgi:carboxypeptidase T